MPPKRAGSEENVASGKRKNGDKISSVVTLSGSIAPSVASLITNTSANQTLTVSDDVMDLSNDSAPIPPNLTQVQQSPSRDPSYVSQQNPLSPASIAKGVAYDKLLSKPSSAHPLHPFARLHSYQTTFMNPAHLCNRYNSTMYSDFHAGPHYVPQNRPTLGSGGAPTLPVPTNTSTTNFGAAASAASSQHPSYDDLQRSVNDLQAQIAAMRHPAPTSSMNTGPSMVTAGHPPTAQSSSSTGMHQMNPHMSGPSGSSVNNNLSNVTPAGNSVSFTQNNLNNGASLSPGNFYGLGLPQYQIELLQYMGQTGISAINPPTPHSNLFSSNQPSSTPSAMHDPIHRQVISGGVTLGYGVDLKLKCLIWQNAFVDLSELLYPEKTAGHYYVTDPKSGEKVLAREKRYIRHIGDWNRAFLHFMAVYNLHPFKPDDLKLIEANDMITYMHEINVIAEGGADFKFYDEKFRIDRARAVDPCPWSTFRADLAFKATQNYFWRPPFHSISNPRSAPPSPIPRGFCFAFHSQGKRCWNNSCSFSHNCPCGKGRHTLFSCRYRFESAEPRLTNPQSVNAYKAPGAEFSS